MRRIIKTAPLHSFFIGLYVIGFIFIRNINEVRFSSTYRSIAIELLVSCVLFGISYLILKSARKAGIFSTLLLVGFFTYGVVYNYLETLFFNGHWPFSHIHRFLIAAYGIVYAALLFFLYRSKRPHYNLTCALNIFVLTLFFLNVPMLVLSLKKQVNSQQSVNPFLAINGDGYKDLSAAGSSSPDVYYIILDGYAGEKTLHDFYSDTHPVLYNYLRAKGFYVADSSRTNYPFTALSLSSSLNMGYLDSELVKHTAPLIYDNIVTKAFRKMNYRVLNIESGFAVTENLASADKTIRTHALNEFENRLLELTILKLDDVLGFSHYIRLKNELGRLNNFLKEKGPRFSFIHIVAPHPPYVLDSSGNRAVRTSASDMAWEPREDYWNQLQYISKSIISFIDQVLAHSQRPPVIIIQSDHGPWIQDANPKNVYEARSRILNAYYVPDSLKHLLYPRITPVNSFRLIFSHLFGGNYPVLTDRPYPFSELTKDITFKKYNQ